MRASCVVFVLSCSSTTALLVGVGAAPALTPRAAAAMKGGGGGFGKPKPPPKAAAKPPSAASAQRGKAAKDFDNLKAGGAPEYIVHVRTSPAGGPPSEWYPVGGIAVPRSSSEDQALALAIFQNEDDLLNGAFRAYPFLKKSEDKFEYGYRLKDFEADPIKVATQENVDKANNPVQQWFNALDNPLNDGSGWFNPLKKL